VGHHDPAYDWALRRKIETHPDTGAAQIVEIRETVREIQIPLHEEERRVSMVPLAKVAVAGLLFAPVRLLSPRRIGA
jgi:hypothetical protein